VSLLPLALACLLILPNLGDRNLWQDEAETALIAKNVLRTGLPLGWDGRNLVTQLSGREMTDSYLWGWTPWLMHYVAAFGMAVAGETAFGARWPFALAGCLTLPLFYVVVARVARDRALALVASLLLVTSVQFLLFARQCRYYSLLPIAFLVALHGYDLLPSWTGVVALAFGLLALFHGNSIAGAIAASGFGIHLLLFRREREVLTKFAVAGGAFLAGSAPWVAAVGLLDRATRPGAPVALSDGVLGALLMTNRYLCPLPVIAGLGIAAAMKRVTLQRTSAAHPRGLHPPSVRAASHQARIPRISAAPYISSGRIRAETNVASGCAAPISPPARAARAPCDRKSAIAIATDAIRPGSVAQKATARSERPSSAMPAASQAGNAGPRNVVGEAPGGSKPSSPRSRSEPASSA
jgi:hypothetical protein